MSNCINSSKVYCKSKNKTRLAFYTVSINSSKVYCKYFFPSNIKIIINVLIVAKCIVNGTQLLKNVQDYVVLIVAKCIVNLS